MERILALSPDLVLDASMQESKGVGRISTGTPGWSELRAVKDGHVVTLTDEAVLRPGPRVAAGIASLARAIHGESELR
jgi:iron complex transport system substrate-binding protein